MTIILKINTKFCQTMINCIKRIICYVMKIINYNNGHYCIVVQNSFLPSFGGLNSLLFDIDFKKKK